MVYVYIYIYIVSMMQAGRSRVGVSGVARYVSLHHCEVFLMLWLISNKLFDLFVASHDDRINLNFEIIHVVGVRLNLRLLVRRLCFCIAT